MLWLFNCCRELLRIPLYSAFRARRAISNHPNPARLQIVHPGLWTQRFQRVRHCAGRASDSRAASRRSRRARGRRVRSRRWARSSPGERWWPSLSPANTRRLGRGLRAGGRRRRRRGGRGSSLVFLVADWARLFLCKNRLGCCVRRYEERLFKRLKTT